MKTKFVVVRNVINRKRRDLAFRNSAVKRKFVFDELVYEMGLKQFEKQRERDKHKGSEQK